VTVVLAKGPVDPLTIGALALKHVAGVGDGLTDDRAAIAAADALAGAGLAVGFGPGTYRVASDLTITYPVHMMPGAVIKPDSGVTVTLEGGFTSVPMAQVFDHSAGGVVAPKSVVGYHPCWWGAVNTTDDTNTWLDMLDAVDAVKIDDSAFYDSGTIVLGQRIFAPTGVSALSGISLTGCTLEMSWASTICPTDAMAAGSVITLNDRSSIMGGGGNIRTSTAGNAVTLIDQQGGRTEVCGPIYIAPRASGSVGINQGHGSGSITPMLRDILIKDGGNLGTGIVVNSSDAKWSNVWIGECLLGVQWIFSAAFVDGLHVWGCTTGMNGGPDDSTMLNVYLDDNMGWGADFDSVDRLKMSGYAAHNGADTAGTGGIRVRFDGTHSCRDNTLDFVLNDNTGDGILIDGATDTQITARVGSGSVQSGGAAVCTNGVRITSGTPGTTVKARGRLTDVLTAVVNDATGTADVDLGSKQVVLTASQVFTSTTTFASLALIPVGKGEKWMFEGLIVADGGQTGDLKLRVSADSSTGASGWWAIVPTAAGSSTSTSAVSANPGNVAALQASGGASLTPGLVGVGTKQAIRLDGYLEAGTAAGNLDLAASQATSDPTSTTVYFARLRARRIF
jgi:hypothetical protein